ncbi:DUF3592 domain-containing protein [Mycobacterium sp. CBMA271]|uniref:DUF3592 domain-containing protein n=1 Tax=unclassified Mycobacteroides TaxID=2618759 RepID=UPI0012DCF5DC|nr:MULTISPECIES: DUF3592 domain-containing protein [unclassified Mycobacteroides]MUM18518.1 hypothetical protein [Mycobacteroides sp. CBMA 326]MUM23787.1 DUF3592 domain-containing protein [Mycobacteroides sp. CBMA 271]
MKAFTRNVDNTPFIVCAIFVVVGLIFAGIGGAVGVHESRFQQHSAVTEGLVIGQEPRRSCDSDGDCHTSDYPIVRFEVEGKQFTFTSNTSGLLSPRTGRDVSVRYNVANPQEAEVNSFDAAWGLPLIFGVLGLALVAVGIFVPWHFRRRE